ncbi:SDR family NAD(P)-dependent oxidoreductase [Rhodoblastus sp.]|uniref:SDR family NAD(P)-dependent oxidoreductase n=1 Tax=Rhodoblastus sp. TaxID=1962975 RepID=UPI0035ADCA6B
MGRLANKVVIITGAAGGIGQAAARRFAAEGAKLMLVDRDEAGLAALAASIGAEQAAVAVADVAEAADVEAYVKATEKRFGRIDALFSNAGTEGRILPIVDYPDNAFDKVIAVNVRGVWLSLRHTIPVMQRGGGGSIVITSSIAGLRGFAGLSAYTASKHAVVGLMRCAVLENARYGVRVNTIHPSPIETRMMRSIEEGAAPGAAAEAKNAFNAMIPAGRYGAPEEVARLALFLSSDESAFCSGGLYTVDGGMAAG